MGVSAGSIAAANNLPGNQGYINCTLDVHRKTGTQSDPLDTSTNPHVELTDNGAVLIIGENCEII